MEERTRERKTMRLIRQVLREGRLAEPFRAKDVNKAIGITHAGTFLPKHRVGNPGHKGKPFTAHFLQVGKGLYRLKDPN